MFQPDGHIPVSQVLCIFLLAGSGRDGHIFYCDGHSVRKPRKQKLKHFPLCTYGEKGVYSKAALTNIGMVEGSRIQKGVVFSCVVGYRLKEM